MWNRFVNYFQMKDEDSEIRECFAYYGRAVFMLQCVEKGICMSLILSYKNITKSRYDELLAEKSRLTLGQLKREIIEKNIFSDEVIQKIENFHKKRDWLAHNYWWDRCIELYRDDLRHKIFEELDTMTSEFEDFDNIIHEECNQFLIKNGINPQKIFSEFASFDMTPVTPAFRKLSKNETLVGIFLHQPTDGYQIPIFKLEDNSYWTLSESGLTIFNIGDPPPDLKVLDETAGIFPVNQFNPRPKITQDWEYELDLKKNQLYVKVQPAELNGKFIFKWTISKRRLA